MYMKDQIAMAGMLTEMYTDPRFTKLNELLEKYQEVIFNLEQSLKDGNIDGVDFIVKSYRMKNKFQNDPNTRPNFAMSHDPYKEYSDFIDRKIDDLLKSGYIDQEDINDASNNF